MQYVETSPQYIFITCMAFPPLLSSCTGYSNITQCVRVSYSSISVSSIIASSIITTSVIKTVLSILKYGVGDCCHLGPDCWCVHAHYCGYYVVLL